MEETKHIKISDYNYPLPDERIAKFPLPVRDQSKLLVYRHGEVSETRFTSLPDYLEAGELMIFNNTKVIQARLHFRKETGALIEIFCLEPIQPNDYVLNFQQTSHAAWLCMTASVVLTISTVALTRPMMQLMQTPDDIIDGAVIYIGWIFAGIPFIFLYNMVAAIMRALGDSKTPLYFLILTSALNIGLDLLFIVPFHFGVLGAALATDISQVISGVLSFIYLRRKFDVLKMEKDDLAFSKKASIRLLGIGVPMGLQCSITAIGSVIMQWAVNVLGSTAVAAVTAAGKTQGLLTVPMESVGTAMATYTGQNLGASRMDRVRQGVNSAMLIILIYGVASAFVLHFTDVQLMGLFLDTAKEVDIVAMGREYLFWNSVFFVPLGALIVWRYSIQGLGFSSLAMLAGVAEMVARTAVAIVLVPILGYFGAELSNPAAWIAACLFLYPAYRWTCRQLDNRLLAARLHIQGDHAETVL